MKQRIRHLYPHNGAVQPEDESVPRGWILPQGHFHKTREHWASINSHFRRPDARAKSREEDIEEAEAAERNAQVAYSLGWISVGHAGKLNAVGHERTFQNRMHPALQALQKLLAECPAIAIQIELQKGSFLPSKGVHEDFEVREYELEALVRRGRLREILK